MFYYLGYWLMRFSDWTRSGKKIFGHFATSRWTDGW